MAVEPYLANIWVSGHQIKVKVKEKKLVIYVPRYFFHLLAGI